MGAAVLTVAGGTQDEEGEMTVWVCRTCAVEYPDTSAAPAACAICSDERQYVPPAGQSWTTVAELAAEGSTGSVATVEPGMFGVTISPRVGIGQRALLVCTAGGNLLWDPTGYVDDELAEAVRGVGGVAAIASSHPHMFGAQVDWARRFDAAIWVQERDRRWVQREDARIRSWGAMLDVLPGIRLHRVGGHFPGSAVAHFRAADGLGVLLSGDTLMVTPDQQWVSFMRSYPNMIPLSATVVRRVTDRVLGLDFDRIYDNFQGRIASAAHERVECSAHRYTAWCSGDHDDVTES